MRDQVVGKRYALALFNAAESDGLTEMIQGNLVLISEILEKNPELKVFLAAPHITTQEKENILQKGFKEKISELLLSFLLFLLSKDRLNQISEIAVQYENLLKEKMGIVEVQVFTASPLDAKLSPPLKETLELKTGKKVNLIFKVDPSLIGGIRVIIGNQIIDYSIRNELCKLKDNLLSLKV